MKKTILSFFFIFLLSVFSYQTSFAQKDNSFTQDQEKVESVEYELPYSGILPDSPLYFLKMTRDKIVSFLISDPLKKAEFNLLQADKRLAGGLSLYNKDKRKIDIVYSTISKGEKYFEQALEKVKEAQKQNMDTKDIARKLLSASKKHQEVLETLKFESLLEKVKDFEKDVEILIPKQ